MPNRYIRASAIESERVNALSWRAEVFFRRLLNRVDDFGRFTSHPVLLRASLFPLQLDKVSSADIEQMLTECEQCGLVFRYVVDRKHFLVVNRWEKGRAKASEYPPPPAEVCERMQTYVYTPLHVQAYAPDSDSDSDSDSDADADAGANNASPRARAKRLDPPQLPEIQVQAAEIKLPEAEAVAFLNYYTANGWRVGRNPMKSWKHALHNWKHRYEEKCGQRQPVATRSLSEADRRRNAIGGLTPEEAGQATVEHIKRQEREEAAGF